VEHVLATKGEAYLRTPDEDMPLFVRLSLDVLAVVLAAAGLLLCLLWWVFSTLTRAAWRRLAKLKQS